MKLSVIVPVYQCAHCLQQCVDSIVCQIGDDAEIILVDDGSTDLSGTLCDNMAGEDSRIRVIHRNNGGLSAARNSGIGAACGDYLTFVDSDDLLEAGALSDNMDYISQHPETDLVEYPVSVHHGSSREYQVSFKPHSVSGDGIFADWILSECNAHAYAWNKIYRRELFDGIRFPEGETFEDIAIMPAIISRCGCVYYSDRGRYLYQENNRGITADYTFRTQEPLFRHNLALACRVRGMSMSREYARLWSGCLNLLTDLYRCSDTDMRYADAASARLSFLRPSLSEIFSARLGCRNVLKYIFAAIFGTGNLCRMSDLLKLTL